MLLGDERDSPRGRIYLIKEMLEHDRPPPLGVAAHLDRCLSCLACTTACPSGVDYSRLADEGRALLHRGLSRPLPDRALRALIARILPKPQWFRLALAAARLARPFADMFGGRLGGMLRLAPRSGVRAGSVNGPGTFAAIGLRKRRVALLAGCVQQVLRPAINDATARLLTRLGCEVVVAPGAGCCGALVHHMGQESEARRQARANVAVWTGEEFDAIVANASGCGTQLKAYGRILEGDPELAVAALGVADRVRDVTELLSELAYEPREIEDLPKVVYHDACSLSHGQGIREEPRRLLERAGFELLDLPDGTPCCGSAGTYNLLQLDLAEALRERVTETVNGRDGQVVASGNIGCLVQLARGCRVPVVHTVELLDWASGGPRPMGL
jgi:glycolate oxidase iron-sulfur subunit